MAKIGIIVTDNNDWTARALYNAAKERNFNPVFINLENIEVSIGSTIRYSLRENSLSELDAVVVRDVGAGSIESVSFRFDVLRQLYELGILIVNTPESIQNAANKYYSTYLMAKANLPVPCTRVVQSVESALKTLDDFRDAIIKPVFGFKGIGIIRIKNYSIIEPDNTTNPKQIEEMVKNEIDNKGMLYIQEYIPNMGRDIRAYVVDGKVIGAIYRTAPDGKWLNNLSQGGSCQRCSLTPSQKEISIKAAKTIGTVFAGVDLIEGNNKTMLLEVNGTPSGAGIYKSLGINPADYIMDYIQKQVRD
ncbi:alpha-L-glutamate ligase, RimK family [Methanohalobium evestigatum Z-7303]|uniref:Alpha-L-glutamate ligase, RimK family n=1 Tax=Methanohalobium evestigatum (strain ATCC BAA-1072 / DSM 3721 / NBRC 107634 / OCM 161 / Z-7303) TaxID=644295 RepID=D7E6J7_METEZ|nr:tetrahydromethanopterin:alpha-L-glutamate ligase [Methanohalobium evestigatum]ADI73219.1 alpha-L-glutamate ligase, RimK family [Methanohalobium evestigatum Z-7303]